MRGTDRFDSMLHMSCDTSRGADIVTGLLSRPAEQVALRAGNCESLGTHPDLVQVLVPIHPEAQKLLIHEGEDDDVFTGSLRQTAPVISGGASW